MANKDNYVILGDFIWEVKSKELKNVDGDTARDGTVVLTPKQHKLLKCLYDAHPNILKKEEIVEQVWSDTFTSPESLPQLIVRTRQTIGDSTKQILVNQPGIGYSLHFRLPVNDKVDTEFNGSGSAKVDSSKQTFGVWQFIVVLMCLATAYNVFEVGSSFYFASAFKQVHQVNPYPNVLSASDGKVDLLIGGTKCVYEKKKLLLRCQ